MIKLTPSALDQMKRLLSQKEGKLHGIRVGINTKGCSGLSYTLEYVEKIDKSDELSWICNNTAKGLRNNRDVFTAIIDVFYNL